MSVTTEIPLEALGSLGARLPDAGTVDVSIEMVGESLGSQVEVKRRPWHALIYDEAGGVLELSVGARGRDDRIVLRHEIHNPSGVWVEEADGLIRALSIEVAEGPRTIVRFHERPSLDAC